MIVWGDGRGGQIRTDDPLHPMQVRFRAALRPDGNYYNTIFGQERAAHRTSTRRLILHDRLVAP